MWVWTTMETSRCPDLLARHGDQLVSMHGFFMFIFIHSVVDLVDSLYVDICGLMVSLFVYANISLLPPPSHQRRVVGIASVAIPAGNPHRRWREMDGLLPYLERLAAGVSDDGWQHLSNDVIASIHSFPPKWTGVMRRMAMTYEHIRRVARGDLPAKDESSEEDDDIESEDESESD